MIAKSLEDALHNAFRGAREDRVATVSVARLIVEVLNNVAIDRSLADHGVDADGLRSELEHRRDLEPREQGPDGEPVDSNPSPALEALVASAMACAGKIRAKGAATNADLLLALFGAPEQQELVGCLEAFALTRPVALEMVKNPELRSGLNRRVLRPRVGPDTTNAAEGELASLLSAHKASGNKTPLEIVDKQFAHAQVVLSVEVDFALHFRVATEPASSTSGQPAVYYPRTSQGPTNNERELRERPWACGRPGRRARGPTDSCCVLAR